MALPKHKTSKRRSRLRRASAYYGKMKAPAVSVCPSCGEKKVPHRVCPHCGFYNGKQIITRVVKEV